MSNNYLPDRGDIVFLDFNPTKRHEQRGYRPALIISPAVYSDRSSLALSGIWVKTSPFTYRVYTSRI